MGFRPKKHLTIEMKNDNVPLLAPSEDDQMDLSKLEIVTGVLPRAGVMQREDGTLNPAVFLRITGISREGQETEHLFSWSPLGLANASNLFNAISLMLVADPGPAVQEIAKAAGLLDETTKVTTKFEGYL